MISSSAVAQLDLTSIDFWFDCLLTVGMEVTQRGVSERWLREVALAQRGGSERWLREVVNVL